MPELSHPEDRWIDRELVAPGHPLVLIADNQEADRQRAAFHLAMAGYPVIEVSSLAGVVDRSRTLRPDVILIADRLDDVDVPQLMVALAEQADLADVPVITVSSDPGSRRAAECLAAGARDHLRRSVDAEELVARVDAVLRADDELERLRRRNAELEFLGAIDPLTGMANRRSLEEELDRMAAGSARHRVPLSAVMARADDLPTSGRGRAGAERREAVLRELGYLVAAVRRTDDFPGVWDDRTFLVLLPMTPADGARAFADRLRAVVGAAPLRYRDELIPLTLSCAFTEVGVDAGMALPALELAVVAAQASGGDHTTGA